MTDPSSIIRQEPEHSVTVSDGSLVATSRPSDPNAPQVRQNLAGEQSPEAAAVEVAEPGLPPRIASEPVPDAPVFERVVAAPEQQVQVVVPAFAVEPVADAPVFERSIQDARAQPAVPPALAPVADGQDSPVDQFLRERRLAIAEQGLSDSDAGGPVIARSIEDRFVAAPVDAAQPQDPGAAPVFERSFQDRSLALDVPARTTASPSAVAVEQSPREGSSVPVPPPLQSQARSADQVPLEQAQQMLSEAAQDVTARVQAAIGAADGQWAEMDFPARVVKLKIENDKVRVRLDELEELADQSRR